MAVGGEGAGREKRSGRDLPDELTEGIASSLEVALGHRTRREILRALSRGQAKTQSPSQLVRMAGVDASVAAVSYHAKMLVKHDAAVIAEENLTGGSTQFFYRSTVASDPEVARILRAMEVPDRSFRSSDGSNP